jgi:serine/threonine-protein kinase
MAILYKQAHEAPEPLRKRAPNAPKNLSAAIERALAKDPTQRFESAAEMAEALEEGAAAPTPSRRQDRRVMVAAGAALVAVLGAIYVFSDGATPTSTETTAARSTSKTVPPTAPPTAAASQPVTVAPTPAPSTAPPTAAATTPAPPSGPAVRLVTLRITSDPPGAQVLERGTPLGRTPLVLRRPAAQRVLALQIKREGYGDKHVTVNLANDAQAHARLEALFELVP